MYQGKKWKYSWVILTEGQRKQSWRWTCVPCGQNRHQYNWEYGERYSYKSHPTLWLCTSGCAVLAFFCFVSSSKHCHESLLPFLLFFSRLPPLPSPFRSPRRLPPLRLWKPAVAGETKGRTWMSFPAAHSQQGRQWGRQAASVFLWKAASHVFSCLPALNKEHKEVYSITQEDNAANVNSVSGSPPFACVFFSHSLSSSLLPCLSLLHFSSTALSL